MMLRLVFAIDSLAGGGAEKVVLTLAKALIEKGHDAIIVSLQKHADYEIDERIPVYYLYEEKRKKLYKSGKRKEHADAVTKLIKDIEAQRGNIDHIFANLDETNYVMAATEFTNVSYIIHNAVRETLKRAQLMGPIKYLRQRKLFKVLSGKRLIAVSDSLKRELQNLSWLKPQSVIRIHNPFDIAGIQSSASAATACVPDFPYMIHIGRLARQKRHDILFKALQLMPDDYRLVCLANDIDRLQKLAKEYGVEHKVITPGFQQNPYAWLKQAKFSILSSDYEGLPLVIIESLICGTPVVATRCEHGPEEILSPLPKSYLAPRRDPKKLAEQAIDCWQQERESEPFSDYTKRYSDSVIADEYASFVRSQAEK